VERIPNKNPLATLEEEKKEHQVKVRLYLFNLVQCKALNMITDNVISRFM
jgi:hypothetical protein